MWPQPFSPTPYPKKKGSQPRNDCRVTPRSFGFALQALRGWGRVAGWGANGTGTFFGGLNRPRLRLRQGHKMLETTLTPSATTAVLKPNDSRPCSSVSWRMRREVTPVSEVWAVMPMVKAK